MIGKLKPFLTTLALCAFAGCREDPVIAVARSDFIERHPKIEIVESGLRKRVADRVVVYVRFVSTPATAFPPRAGIWEDEMVYMTKDGKWQCVSVEGGKFIRPAR
jgi:hypothetical protein